MSKPRKVPPRPDCLGCEDRASIGCPCKAANKWADQDADRPRKVYIPTHDGRRIRVSRLIYEHQIGRDIYNKGSDTGRKKRESGAE